MAILSPEERKTLLDAADCMIDLVSEYGPTSLPARLRTSLMRIAGPDHDSTNAEQLAKVAKLLAPEAMEPRGPTPDDMRTFGEAI